MHKSALIYLLMAALCAQAGDSALLHPERAIETAPESYRVKLATTKGDVVIEVTRAWAPKGADRFYNLVKLGYYDECAFYRVISGFMAQFGFNADPQVSDAWMRHRIKDDPVSQSNTRGMISFATSGPNTRTTQLFINYRDNSNLDGMGFAPFGKVIEGMKVIDKLYKGYGEGAPRGRGPSQGMIRTKGNAYLDENFPKLDYIKKAIILDDTTSK